MLIIRLNGWATVANVINQSSSKLGLATIEEVLSGSVFFFFNE